MGKKQAQGYAAHAEIENHVGRERRRRRGQPRGFAVALDAHTEPSQHLEHDVDIIAPGYAGEMGRNFGQRGHEQVAQGDGLASGQRHVGLEGTLGTRNREVSHGCGGFPERAVSA